MQQECENVVWYPDRRKTREKPMKSTLLVRGNLETFIDAHHWLDAAVVNLCHRSRKGALPTQLSFDDATEALREIRHLRKSAGSSYTQTTGEPT